MTQNNLGIAYRNRIRGESAENLESAIAAYHAALLVYTPQAFPVDWAMTQNNLGTAYSDRIRGESAENLESAIAAYHAVLSVYTPQAFPQNWARTQNNLGIAYRNRIRGEKAENLELAIAAFKKALEICTPTTLPLDCFRTGENLGDTAFTEGLWATAIEGYEQAVKAVELTRSWATSDTSRQEILSQAIHVYQNLVQACINNGQLQKAIKYVESSRSRLLVDLMASNDLYSSGEIPPFVKEYLQQYESRQHEIDEERDRIRFDNSRDLVGVGTNLRSRAAFEADNQKIKRLEDEKQEIWSQIRRLDPVLAGEIQVSAPDFAAMQQLIDLPNSAILSFYTTNHDTHIFILRKDGSPRLHTCLGQGGKTLQNWIFYNWLKPYVENKARWISQMSHFLKELAKRLNINDLVAKHLEGIEELILIPHLYLHQIPFAALPLETGFLGDKFLIRYAPSCQILEFCHQRPAGETLQAKLHYGIVENATDDLLFTSFECEKIAQLFPDSQRLQGSREATVSNYHKLAKQVKGLHSSHHAQSRLDNLLESRLYLGDGSITLGQLMSPGWRLPQLLEVFLSCCETNLSNAEITDDILTLSTGFLCAGARSVINTLWAVDDLATALFSISYYEYRQEGHSRAEAVRKSQMKLRTLSGETLKTLYQAELNPLLEMKISLLEMQHQQAESARNEALSQRNKARGTAAYEEWDFEYMRVAKVAIALENSTKRYKSLYVERLPFAHPRYWAAFTCQGLR